MKLVINSALVNSKATVLNKKDIYKCFITAALTGNEFQMVVPRYLRKVRVGLRVIYALS